MTFFSRRNLPEEKEEESAEQTGSVLDTESEETKTPPLSLAQPIGFATVLGPHSVMNGTLHCEANVRLDGSFTGEMKIGGNVLVGETARISADIHARNVSVAGAVRGNIQGRKVQLLRSSRVWGDIEATALSTEEGAFIDGKITMVSHEAASIEAPGFDLPAAVDSIQEPQDNHKTEASPSEEPANQRDDSEVAED